MPRFNPYLFVVGCPRSGTTLLQRMLDSHPEMTVANDTHFIPVAIEDLDPHPELPLTESILERIRTFRTRAGKGFQRLGVSASAFETAASHARTYPQLVSELYTELARLRGKPLAGEKTPDYVRHLPVLHALFPWAKVVHLIRDGRDTAMALRDWAGDGKGPGRLKLWSENPIAACTLWWQWQVSTGLRDAVKLGASYVEVRYEALVSRPEDTLRGITAFLELPFDSGMLTYNAGRLRTKPGLQTNKAWLPPTPGVRDWRKNMQPDDVELVEALAGGLLAELGYDLAFDTISPDVQAKADRYRAWWNRKLARRHERKAASSLPAIEATGT